MNSVGQHDALDANLIALLFYIRLQALAMALGLSPDAADRDQPFANLFKHQATLLIGQQATQPHHLSG